MVGRSFARNLAAMIFANGGEYRSCMTCKHMVNMHRKQWTVCAHPASCETGAPYNTDYAMKHICGFDLKLYEAKK